MVRASRAFNVAQLDGYALDEPEPADNAVDPIASADAFIQATGARIQEGGQSAFYHRIEDATTMLDRHRFRGTPTCSANEGWYPVLLHELTHWTGDRAARDHGENP